MKKLTVCNVTEEGRFGGPQRRIVQVADALKPLGIETCIVYPRMESEALEQYILRYDVKSKQMDITRLSKRNNLLIRYAFRFVWETFKLAKFFRSSHFDLVHVNGSGQFKVAIAAKLSKVPVIWHLNDTYAPNLVRQVFNLVAPRCAAGFIIAGERVREYYLAGTNLKNLPCTEIHAPVNLEVFNPDRINDHQVNRSCPLRIGTVSNVNPAKGLEYFVDMAAQIMSINPDVEFIVAGSILDSQKPYYNLITTKMLSLGLTDENIQFIGLVEDVPAFLGSLDICVFTSVTEASPTSVWEAMAMSKPIVTTDVGSVSQYIKHGVSGYIVPVGDIEKLVGCTRNLIESDPLRISLGHAARQVAMRNLSIDAAAQHHASIYHSVMAIKNDN